MPCHIFLYKQYFIFFGLLKLCDITQQVCEMTQLTRLLLFLGLVILTI